jgi:hypothetical protein
MACVGMGSDGSFNSDTWWYDVIADAWNYTCTFSGGGRRSVAAFAIGNVGYMGTGKSSGGTKQDFYRLDADVSVNDIAAASNLISVFPNPVTIDGFTAVVETELTDASILILNQEGKLMSSEPLLNREKHFDRNELKSGLYFIVIKNKKQLLATKKIILL